MFSNSADRDKFMPVDISKSINCPIKQNMKIKTWVEIKPYEQISVSLGRSSEIIKPSDVTIKASPKYLADSSIDAQFVLINDDKNHNEAFLQLANYTESALDIEVWVKV